MKTLEVERLTEQPQPQQPPKRRRPAAFRFGAGLVSGASDNDPTTVATLAVIGSTLTYGLAWLTLLVIPMLAVIQAIAAQVGTCSRHGLQSDIRKLYGFRWAIVTMLAVLIVNVITLAADLEGGGAAMGLLTSTDYRWWVVPLAVLTVVVLVFGNYRGIESVLKYTSLLFVTYVGAAILARPNWPDVLRHSLIPTIDIHPAAISGTLALLGTTLTAYAYVWETIELSEERPPVRRLGLVQADAGFGIVVAGITFWFIEIATGATLGVHHHTVQTAQDAAEALVPIAGKAAAYVFGIGLLGSALIAVPVLACTSAYVVSELFGWRGSVNAKFYQAKHFYAVLIGVVAIALAVALAGVPPITLLYYSGIAGGIATPLTMFFLILVARDPTVMHRHRISPWLARAGWAVTAVVSLATVVYLAQTVSGSF